MRDLITNVGSDYVAFAISGILVLIVTLLYLWWVSSFGFSSNRPWVYVRILITIQLHFKL